MVMGTKQEHAKYNIPLHLSGILALSHLIYFKVSGLSSSKVSVCSLLIIYFSGGKVGWDDKATQCFALYSARNPLEPLILGNLQVTTSLSLPV